MEKKKKEDTLQLILAALLSVAGFVLLMCGFWAPPKGEIHSTVLMAYGEVMTFVGALLGMDYNYRKYLPRKSDSKRAEQDNKN